MMRRFSIVSITSVVLLVILSGCNDSSKDNAPVIAAQDGHKAITLPSTDEKPKSGAEIYTSRCVGCHGPKGQGIGTYPKIAGNGKEQVIKKINGYLDDTYGKEQKAIMKGQARALSEYEKTAVAEYVETLK